MHTAEDLLGRLDTLGIGAATRRHAPVFTVEEMMTECADLPGLHTKNLFLRDAKKRYFLVSMRHDAALDLKSLRHTIGARGGLSFGSADALQDMLGVASGSVSPFALINDSAHAVSLCLEDRLMEAPIINFHPLANDRTTAIAPADLRRFLATTGHEPLVFSLVSQA